MFLIVITYKKSVAEIGAFLKEHIAFLDEAYKNNYFIISGPKSPRTGGIILTQISDRDQLERIINKDPFLIHDVANYEIIEFIPTKYHPIFSNFIQS